MIRRLLLAIGITLPINLLFVPDRLWWIALLDGMGAVLFFAWMDDRYERGSLKKKGHTSGKPSPRWALFRKQVIGRPGWEDYLIRYRLIMTPYASIMIHRINRPDSDDHPHDHPWSFVSVILRGGYIEELTSNAENPFGPRSHLALTAVVDRKPGHWHRFKRGYYHRITALPKGHAWTLVLTGPRRDSWGFLVDGRRVDWKTYLEDA